METGISGWFAFSLFYLLLTMHCSVRTSVFPHSCQEGALMYGVRAQSMAETSQTVWVAVDCISLCSLCLQVLLDLNSIGRCCRKIGSGELRLQTCHTPSLSSPTPVAALMTIRVSRLVSLVAVLTRQPALQFIIAHCPPSNSIPTNPRLGLTLHGREARGARALPWLGRKPLLSQSLGFGGTLEVTIISTVFVKGGIPYRMETVTLEFCLTPTSHFKTRRNPKLF